MPSSPRNDARATDGSAPEPGGTAAAGAAKPVRCDDCAAVCCRLEVLCLTETGVPRRYLRPNPGGVPSMNRLEDGWCAALDRDTLRCSIYDRRPAICRQLEMGGPDCVAERAHWAEAHGLADDR